MLGSYRLGHLPALDGLRGVFVLAVVAYHLGLPLSRGGYLGVDGFFVLSGFLITSLLLEEWQNRGAISLKRFYCKRALRLFPALYTFLLVFTVATLLCLPFAQAVPNLRGAIASFFYVSNWTMVYLPRFGVTDSLGMLGHTWSLAIEEQFYLLWPVALILMLRFLHKKAILLSLSCFLVVLVLWKAYMYLELQPALHGWQSYENMRLYAGTDARADCLVIGSLLACALNFGLLRPSYILGRVTRILLAVLLPFLAIALAFSVGWTEAYLYGGFTGIGLVFGLCILNVVVAREGFLARLCSLAPLRDIGKVSYGLYLWHPPIFVAFGLMNGHWTNWPLQLLGLAVTAVAVGLSYRFIELPALRLKSRLAYQGEVNRGGVLMPKAPEARSVR